MMKILTSVGLLLSILHLGSSETGCPEPDEISPCTCSNSPFTYLECKGIDDAKTLRTIFINSERYRYKEVHIEYSTVQYLPHDMFDRVPVIELYLKNVTIAQLFDSPPTALGELRTLFIENSLVQRGIIWELLEPLKSLRFLNIYYNSVKTLGHEFSQYAPKDLEALTFFATATKTIQPGTFAEFKKLDKLAVDAGKLTHLSRDIFAVPFNGRVLYFNDNKLTTISGDFFTQMPNLQTLGLRNNQIAVLPESAFQGSGEKLEYLVLDDNPIKCDCRLLWLIQSKPHVLEGRCESPKSLHGKELKDVTAGDLHC